MSCTNLASPMLFMTKVSDCVPTLVCFKTLHIPWFFSCAIYPFALKPQRFLSNVISRLCCWINSYTCIWFTYSVQCCWPNSKINQRAIGDKPLHSAARTPVPQIPYLGKVVSLLLLLQSETCPILPLLHLYPSNLSNESCHSSSAATCPSPPSTLTPSKTTHRVTPTLIQSTQMPWIKTWALNTNFDSLYAFKSPDLCHSVARIVRL